jgi:cyclopropane-fatty-acyl-phospholipid synthase
MTITLQPRVRASSALLPPPPPSGVRARIARAVVRRILGGVSVTARLVVDGQVYGAPLDEQRPTLDIDQPGPLFARLARSPMIGLGEAYMAREWGAAEGTDLADVLAPFAEKLTDLIKPAFYRCGTPCSPAGSTP